MTVRDYVYAKNEDVIAVRLFPEHNGDWTIDGVDQEGNHTEDYESHLCLHDAVLNVESFVRCYFPHLLEKVNEGTN